MSCIVWAWLLSCSAAEALCWAFVALPWVTLSSCVIAVPTCWIPCDCSLAAVEISATSASAAATFWTISSSDSPTLLQLTEPRRLLAIAASIFSAVSLAAAAERWASDRTSSATTAKPAPASPALAASTAALRARMLVWKAISSMFLTIFATSALEASMACMAVFMSTIVWAPDWAATRAWLAKAFAFSALSAVLRIITDISSSAALVSATLEPCSLHPSASDWLADESWPEAEAVCVAPSSSESEIAPKAPLTARMMPQPSREPTPAAVSRRGRMIQKLDVTLPAASFASVSASWML